MTLSWRNVSLISWAYIFSSLFMLTSSEGNGLLIIPESPTGIYPVALGKSNIFTCVGKVEVPERLTDIRWWWPNGKQIETTDSRVETLPGDQPGSLSLYFSSIQEQDLGNYSCSATYATNQQLNTTFVLSAFVPITFEDAPTNQYAVKNSDYKVKCRVKADPPPQVDWKKDHRTINASDHYLVDKDGIVIRGVTESDEGVYTCRVRVISMGKVEERHIQLEVQEKPVITSEAVEVEGVESESASMICTATGKPSPEYIWVNHKGQDLSELERFTVDKYKGTLQVDGLKREDTGTYRCTAKNSAGFNTTTSRLVVITKPVVEEFKNVTSQVTGEAVLTCRASGEPAPDVVFRKDSNKEPFGHGVQTDRIFTDQHKDRSVTTAQIKIDNLLRADDGLYVCIASTKRTKTELTGHLTVEFPPSFANTPMEETWSWDGKLANVTCLAEAIPNATISWFIVQHPERAVDRNTPNMEQIGFQSLSSLQILPVDRGYYGFYKCVATNKLGTSEHRVHLREARKPGPILQVIEQEKTATSIAYKIVGPVDDGGLPVTAFVVQYKEDRHGWEKNKIKSWPVDQQVFIVEDLEPLSTYYFRFAAENAVGIGDWAQERSVLMPRRSAPEPPTILTEVHNGVAITPYTDYFELRWGVPADNGDKIEVFEVSYTPVRNVSNGWENTGKTTVEEKALGEPRHILRNLTPGTYYRVEIRAKNKIGLSGPSQIIIKTAPTQGGDMAKDPVKQGGINVPLIVVVSVVVFLIICIIVDITCYQLKRKGILWTISHKCCSENKKGRHNYGKHTKGPQPDQSDIPLNSP